MRWLAPWLAFTIAWVVPQRAHAQQRSALKLSIRSTADALRSNAPLLLDVTLIWNSPRLLEGRLELDLYAGQQRVARYRSREVVLSDNKVTLPLMLPPVVLPDERTACTLQARFDGADANIELGGYDVAAQVQRRRVLVAGVVVSENSSSPPAGVRAPDDQPFALHESLRIESRLARDDLQRDLSCRVVEVRPEALPECGLELAAYDVLIVTTDGLEELRTSQLAAIADWVEAGGSACVIIDEARDREDQALLQRVSGGSVVDPVLAFDPSGKPRLLRAGPAGWHRGAPGIGRSVVAVEPIDVVSREWQREVCYLLGIRAGRVDALLAADQMPGEESSDEMYAGFDPSHQPYAPRPVSNEAGMLQLLLPQKIAGVPFGIVCGLLAACLLAVAPGEYVLLGLLRRRRWTWIVFPSTALTCTLFMIGLAQSYVGNSDHATSLTFVDLAADGRVVRTSRFELTFTAGERMLEAPVEEQFVVAVDTSRRQAAPVDPYGWQPVPQPPAQTATPSLFDVAQAPFAYEGRAPVNYALSRPMRQWSPRLARWTAFGHQAARAAPQAGIDWSAVAWDALADEGEQRALAAQLQQLAPAVYVLVASAGRTTWQNPEGRGFASYDPAAAIAGLVFAASVREDEGYFRHFAQRSPACGPDMEDLALLDRTDSRQRLVIVLVADGEGNYTAYRRVVRGSE